MDHLECPSEEEWTRRREWFEALFDIENKRGGSYLIGEQATGLLVDLQSVYCSGAFIACLILACTIIDAQIREVDVPGLDGGIQAAFQTSGFHEELEWLRSRRNRLVHFKESKDPAITVDMHYADREAHEQEAQRAIELVADVLFEHPGT
jgi:hypothetical protein